MNVAMLGGGAAVNGIKWASNTVYQSVVNGAVNYVGITINLERRAAKHMLSKGMVIDAIPGLTNLTRFEARSVEQVLIKYHGLSNGGGGLLNKINSIAPNNPIYKAAINRGT